MPAAMTLRSAISILAGAALLLASSVFAKPKFEGLATARPAPGAALLTWTRATPGRNGGTVTYRVEREVGGKWQRVAEVKGTDYVALDLAPGKAHRFRVRASDKSGTESNTRVVSVTPQAKAPEVEWRGVWVSRFEWAKGNGSEIRQRLATIMSALSQANANAVIFQVRGQGDTLYPSPMEPWSDSIPAEMRREDPVAIAIREAKRNGLEFHAWFNLLVVWQSKSKAPPSDREHPFYRFANPNDPARRLGVVHDTKGKPIIWGDSDYVWLTPGNPDVEAHARRVVMEFLMRYDVDGIHWDDRTATPNGASHDPVSVRRFKGRGNPNGVRSMGEWQREQLGRMLTNIYVQATARKPSLLVSMSPFGINDKSRIKGYDKYKDSIHDFGTDGVRWLRDGALDALMPQIYWAEGDPTPNYGELVRDWIAQNNSGRPIWPGSAIGNFGGTQPLDTHQRRYVALARALRTGGNTFWSWTAAKESEWRASRSFLYPAKARVPDIPHKTSPKTGQILGTVTDAKGKPLTDVWVRLPGRKFVYLTAADGIFAIPLVAPGEHTIELDWGKGRTKQKVTVQAGRTASLRVRLP